ncbi:MAG: carotenoid 1,2-hydratase [Candidatus Tectomicrobia bacterium]|uniref:Carotenoid 1,2-hydratase n=1 Tax=Tectimicrobiota bacterium TaxID=2528274 RepID=A0A937W435_UNCTE|nr:carotenoid 1,2-hydratase [Candidatus Tectomicrobia bacterium]
MGRRWLWLSSTLVLCLVVLVTSHTALLGFQQAVPGYTWQFPADHAAHPAYRTEWWYYTGHLRTTTGKRYGYQLTFFRHRVDSPGVSLNPSQWFADHIYMAHMAITDVSAKRFVYGEKLNRAALGLAGASEQRYHVWNEDWAAERLGGMHYLVGEIPGYKLKLIVTPSKPPVLHGAAQDGLSQKGEGKGHASHYYSFTRLKTEGVLHSSEGPMDVVGESWMDHEFGSSQLTPTQVGWDWFSVQLTNNTELMLYIMRHQDGSVDPHSSGTLIRPDGSSVHLPRAQIHIQAHAQWKSPKSGAVYPQRWTIQIPTLDVTLHLEPVLAEQELVTEHSTRITYWEGSVTVHGTLQGQATEGVGYVELTGYVQRVTL